MVQFRLNIQFSYLLPYCQGLNLPTVGVGGLNQSNIQIQKVFRPNFWCVFVKHMNAKNLFGLEGQKLEIVEFMLKLTLLTF